MKRKWIDKKVLILGLSRSGISAAKFLNSKGAECFITEFKPATEKDLETIKELERLGIKVETGGHSDEFINDSYIAVTSPGIPPHAPIFKRLEENKISVTSEVELAYLETVTPFVAITGTNGKTTTTSLISHILNSEFIAPECGNIGVPPTSLIDNKNDYLVCEMSSYQTEMSPTFRPQIACFLNFTPDHIDWHNGLENYFNAKAKIFADYKQPAFSIFNALDEKVFEFGSNYSGEKYFFGKEFEKNCAYIKNEAIYFKKSIEEEIIKLSDVPLVGEHNYQNIMCAVIVAKIIGLENEKIAEQIKSFKAVEHRIEFVANVTGKDFYNDSKATNPEASIFAIKSFENKSLTLIAGGRDKNTDLTEFCNMINNHVNHVILIGEAAQRFNQELEKINYHNVIFANSLQEAVDKALELDNQVVLLSPACASFDMFENYEKRGEVFKEYVSSKI